MASTAPSTSSQFDKDLKDLHLIYDYDAHDADGSPEKWRYEMWFFSENRIIYAIHGGPMAGRKNFQTAHYKCVRAGEIWQCSWLEETGTLCSMVYDIPQGLITTMIGFSKGHWEQAEAAHGDKRNPEDFERWRGLAKVGIQTDRHVLVEQARVLERFYGKGELESIEEGWETL